jgi:hypothetical protein
VVSALAALAAVGAAFWTVRDAREAAREARHAGRPFFTLEAPTVDFQSDALVKPVALRFRNVGGRPATDLALVVVVSHENGSPNSTDAELGTDVAHGTELPFTDERLFVHPSMKAVLLVRLRYSDPVSSERVLQDFAWRFDGYRFGPVTKWEREMASIFIQSR